MNNDKRNMDPPETKGVGEPQSLNKLSIQIWTRRKNRASNLQVSEPKMCNKLQKTPEKEYNTPGHLKNIE